MLNERARVGRGAKAALLGFLAASMAGLGLKSRVGVHLLENESEDILEQLQNGRTPKLYSMAGGRAGVFPGMARQEQNYLYFTRRFPHNITNNTIGAGALVAGDYDYFNIGRGDAGSGAGYFSVSALNYQQTNMAPGGKVPSGKGYQMTDLAVSFNSTANASDIAQCLDVMSLKYDKAQGGVVVEHGPINFWPGGVGISGFASAATTVAATTIDRQFGSNGVPTMANVRRFATARTFSANESFVYQMHVLANLPKSNAAVALGDFVEVRVWMFGFVYDAIVG